MLLYHPIFDKDKYEHYEITFRETCCFPDTKNIGLEYYCGEYFKRRPRDDGERYENPALGKQSLILIIDLFLIYNVHVHVLV